MTRTITIERPDGQIPGLLAVNAYLSKAFGVTAAAMIDLDDKANLKYVGTQLRRATIENDSIVVGEVIVDGK